MAAILDFRLTNLTEDLITIEMSHANFGAYIIICTIHPKNNLVHSKNVTTCPKAAVTTCPNVISLTKFAIVENTVYHI